MKWSLMATTGGVQVRTGGSNAPAGGVQTIVFLRAAGEERVLGFGSVRAFARLHD
jgi:hypothetical protein